MTTIYCFCNRCEPEWHEATALTDAGECVAQHICSSHGFIEFDLVKRRKADYDKEFGVGEWEAVMVDDPRTHEGILAAVAKSKERVKANEEASK